MTYLDRRYWVLLAQTYTWPSLALRSHLSLLQMPATLQWRASDTKAQVNTIREVHCALNFACPFSAACFSGVAASPDFRYPQIFPTTRAWEPLRYFPAKLL